MTACAGARRIGDEDDGTPRLAEFRERVACRREGRDAVMDHAPNVTKQRVVIAGERLETLDETDQLCLLNCVACRRG